MKEIKDLSKNDFDALVNTKFKVTPKGWKDKVEIELLEIKEKQTDMTESFSMIFKGPEADLFPHDTHLVEHPKLGKYELFLGPINYGKTDAVYYQMIFNRLKETK